MLSETQKMGGSWPAERTAIATTSRLLQQVLGQWQFRTQDKDKLVAMKPSIPLASVYSAQWTPKLVQRGSPTKIERSYTCQRIVSSENPYLPVMGLVPIARAAFAVVVPGSMWKRGIPSWTLWGNVCRTVDAEKERK